MKKTKNVRATLVEEDNFKAGYRFGFDGDLVIQALGTNSVLKLAKAAIESEKGKGKTFGKVTLPEFQGKTFVVFVR